MTAPFPMKRPLTLFLTIVLAASAFAKDAAPATHDFIAADAVDYRALLTAPPDTNSIAARGEQDLMRNLQKARTPGQVATAKYYEKLNILLFLAPVLGDWCTAENLPRTAAVFAQVRLEARPTIDAAKKNWDRTRPYLFDGTLQPVVERPNNTSYPSGHSFDSALYATLLASILPEHAADWQAEAALVRWSRVVGGAHYPSDTVAGAILGEAVGKKMLESPKLRAALEEVRVEIAAQQSAHVKKAA